MKSFVFLLALAPVALYASLLDELSPEPKWGGNLGPNNCTKLCKGMQDGIYKSCLGCDVFTTCIEGQMTDNQPCGKGKRWDDDEETCVKREQTNCADPIKSTYACERLPTMPLIRDLRMQCIPGRTIKVVEALWGRRSRRLCPDALPVQNLNCGDVTASTAKLASLCNGHNYCTVAPTSKFLGDPCFGTWKYLTVKYQCLHE